MTILVVSLKNWQEAKARNGVQEIATRVEDLCFTINGLFSPEKGKGDICPEVIKSSAFQELKSLLASLPEDIRPKNMDDQKILLWAIIMAGRLGRRSL